MFEKWKQKRLERKIRKALYALLIEYVENGGEVLDLLLPCFSGAVEWDQGLQTWKLYIENPYVLSAEDGSEGDVMDLKAGMYIRLLSGRGGAEENAKVSEVLGDGWFALSFDLKDFRSTSWVEKG